MRRSLPLVLCALGVVALAGPSGSAAPGDKSRATTIGAPNGTTYYLFGYGSEPGPFADPSNHGLAVYQETNGVDATACPEWREGLPLGHAGGATPLPSSYSGLQTADNACGVEADTKLFDTAGS